MVTSWSAVASDSRTCACAVASAVQAESQDPFLGAQYAWIVQWALLAPRRVLLAQLVTRTVRLPFQDSPPACHARLALKRTTLERSAVAAKVFLRILGLYRSPLERLTVWRAPRYSHEPEVLTILK